MDDNRRCHATVHKTGNRCKKAAILGGRVCATHGGAAPQVKKAAGRRLLEQLQGPALARLADLIADDDTPRNVQLGAVNSVMDRTGLTKTEQIQVLTDEALVRLLAEERELDA